MKILSQGCGGVYHAQNPSKSPKSISAFAKYTAPDSGPFLCCDKIPELILRFVPMISNLMRRRMNLHRKDIGCIEDLYKDRKTDKVVPLPEDLPFYTGSQASERRLSSARISGSRTSAQRPAISTARTSQRACATARIASVSSYSPRGDFSSREI